MNVAGQVVAAAAFVLVTLGLVAFFVFVIGGSRQERKTLVRDRALLRADVPHGEALHFYFLVPCLNEEVVIGETVRALLENDDATVVVIDDGSDDRTAATAREAGGDRVVICRRELPNARRGKGPALNAGFRTAAEHAHLHGRSGERVVVGIVDADGRLSVGALRILGRLFADPGVDAVQLPVEIRNRGRLITDFQDWEFWGFSALQQHLRGAAGAVSLGGNGQFVRLSTLAALDRPPWGESLTEDLDLALVLAAGGARLLCTPSASVTQQGVETIPRLIRQRARWLQGTIECAHRLPRVWSSPDVRNLAALEMAVAVLAPLLFLLPWSIIFTLGWALSIVNLVDVVADGGDVLNQIRTIAIWYVASFAPILIGGFVYYRRRNRAREASRRISVARALLLSHLFVFYNYVNFAGVWLALWRIVTRQHGWEKTIRTAEPSNA